MEEQHPSQDQNQSDGSDGILPSPVDLQFPKPRWPDDSTTSMAGSVQEDESFEKTCFDIVSGFAIVLMGASGSGKSTVGELLSKKVPCPFIDADDFHTQENKEKMRSGVPLTEMDRMPWLENLRNELAKYTSKGEWVVLACSALRAQYRNILLSADQSDDFIDANMKSEIRGSTRPTGTVVFAFLKGSVELLASRLDARHKEGMHFMPPSLLKSQLDTLEITEGDPDILPLDASLTPEEIVDTITNKLLVRL